MLFAALYFNQPGRGVKVAPMRDIQTQELERATFFAFKPTKKGPWMVCRILKKSGTELTLWPFRASEGAIFTKVFKNQALRVGLA